MTATEPTVLDARGLRCPLPVIALARAAAAAAPGSVLTVWADDPAARSDIPAWGRLKGHPVQIQDLGAHTAYTVVIGRRDALPAADPTAQPTTQPTTQPTEAPKSIGGAVKAAPNSSR